MCAQDAPTVRAPRPAPPGDERARRRDRRLVVTAGAPGALLVAIATLMLAAAAAGRHPLWDAPPVRNVAEAILILDSGETARRLEAGEAADGAYDVRPQIHASSGRLTPIEAAAMTREPVFVDLVTAAAPRLDRASLVRALCLARRAGAEAVERRLQAQLRDAPSISCGR